MLDFQDFTDDENESFADDFDNYKDSAIEIEQEANLDELDSDYESYSEEEEEEEKEESDEEWTTEEPEQEILPYEFVERVEEETSKAIDAIDQAIDYINRLQTENEKLKSYGNNEKLLAIAEMVEGNPSLYHKYYNPQELMIVGHSPELSQEEIEQIVYDRLSQTFGKDYHTKYDASEAQQKGTLSNRMFSEQQKILEEIEERNKSVENIDIRDTIRNKFVENNYYNRELRSHLGGDYIDYLETAAEKLAEGKYTITDLYLADHILDIVDDFIELSKRAGRQELLNELKSSGINFDSAISGSARTTAYRNKFDAMNPWGKFDPFPIIER